jgi:hypothetical protein
MKKRLKRSKKMLAMKKMNMLQDTHVASRDKSNSRQLGRT